MNGSPNPRSTYKKQGRNYIKLASRKSNNNTKTTKSNPRIKQLNHSNNYEDEQYKIKASTEIKNST